MEPEEAPVESGMSESREDPVKFGEAPVNRASSASEAPRVLSESRALVWVQTWFAGLRTSW